MKRDHWKYAITSIVVVGLVWFGITSFQESLTPYRTFSEAVASGSYVQVNGTLPDPESTTSRDGMLHFRLQDEEGEVLDVVYAGVKPANFEQATSVVAIGRYADGTFRADQLLVKCPSKYQAEGGESYVNAREAPTSEADGSFAETAPERDAEPKSGTR